VKPGDVFRWNNFPDPQFGGEIKARWFIYLGDSGIITSPTTSYIVTTTTQVRNTGKNIPFKKDSSMFDEDCFLYYDDPYYSYNKGALEANGAIDIISELDPTVMRTIYNNLLTAQNYSKVVLRDIHSSLNNIGITGLRRP
jgi:hypothetical protein